MLNDERRSNRVSQMVRDDVQTENQNLKAHVRKLDDMQQTALDVCERAVEVVSGVKRRIDANEPRRFGRGDPSSPN